MTNLSLYLIESADMYPGAAALRYGGATTTYSELADQAARFAAYICASNVQPGDRVAVILGSRPEFAAAFFGVLHAGAVVVPLDPLQSSREVQTAVTNTGARLVVSAARRAPVATAASLAAGTAAIQIDRNTLDDLADDFTGIPRPVSRAANDDAVILPSGAVLTHANLVSTQAVIARSVLDLGPDDVMLGCSPFFHAFGLTCGLLATVCTGSTMVLLPSLGPWHVLETVTAEHVTVMQAAPEIYRAMLGASGSHHPGSLRLCICGGPALSGETHRRFEEQFGCVVLEGYGMSDSAPASCFNQLGALRKVGSIGLPVHGVQVRVVDEGGDEAPVGAIGELQVRGHNVMKGYWRQPAATAAVIVDGWFRTRDTGFVDEDGYFYVVGRSATSPPGDR